MSLPSYEYGFGGTAPNELFAWQEIVARARGAVPQGLPPLPMVTVPAAVPPVGDLSYAEMRAAENTYRTAPIRHNPWKGVDFSKHARALMDTLYFLSLVKLPLASWLVFRSSQWPPKSDKKLPPFATASFLLSSVALKKNLQWFSEEAGSLCQSRVVMVPASKELALRFYKARRIMLLGDDPAVCMAKYFPSYPNGKWGELRALAQSQAVVEQAKVLEQFKEGVFLWK